MTQDDIIRMAQEAGIHVYPEFEGAFERFAEFVAASEREACALTCEQAGVDGYGTLAAAALIRRRGEA